LGVGGGLQAKEKPLDSELLQHLPPNKSYMPSCTPIDCYENFECFYKF